MIDDEFELIKEGLELLDAALSRFMECEKTEIGKALSSICYGAILLAESSLKDYIIIKDENE